MQQVLFIMKEIKENNSDLFCSFCDNGNAINLQTLLSIYNIAQARKVYCIEESNTETSNYVYKLWKIITNQLNALMDLNYFPGHAGLYYNSIATIAMASSLLEFI